MPPLRPNDRLTETASTLRLAWPRRRSPKRSTRESFDGAMSFQWAWGYVRSPRNAIFSPIANPMSAMRLPPFIGLTGQPIDPKNGVSRRRRNPTAGLELRRRSRLEIVRLCKSFEIFTISGDSWAGRAPWPSRCGQLFTAGFSGKYEFSRRSLRIRAVWPHIPTGFRTRGPASVRTRLGFRQESADPEASGRVTRRDLDGKESWGCQPHHTATSPRAGQAYPRAGQAYPRAGQASLRAGQASLRGSSRLGWVGEKESSYGEDDTRASGSPLSDPPGSHGTDSAREPSTGRMS